jgi:basic amino acid/polyamine antiporter, APA family
MDAKSTTSVFLRAASGLIKSAGTLDVFIYNVGLISIGMGVAITHFTGPANYPGGNIIIASLIAAAVMTCVGAAYWLWTVTLPRSGGIYVFVTRGLSPSVGFALSFVESCCWLFYNAVAGVLISTVGISPLFSTLGLVTGNPKMNNIAKMMETQLAQFLFGAVLIILSGLLLILGMRRFFLVQKIMFVIALVGTVLMLFSLAFYSHETFIANFNRYMASLGPNAYDSVIQSAKKAGWQDVPFDWWQTLRLSVWPFLPLIGGAFSISIGGEVRQVEKSQGIGILGAVISSGIVFALVGYLSYLSIGYEFQGAITYNADHVPAMSTPIKPYFTLLLGILTNNLIITAIIAASFIAWIYFWVPGMLAYAERAILAWSFDRLAPDSVGYVSDRYHTPVVAIMITVIVSITFLALYVYTSFFATLIFIMAGAIAWFITTVTGIFFPYRVKNIYEKSPVSRYQVAGIPLMSIANLLASLGLLLMIVLLWNDPLAAGHDAKSLGTIIGVFGLGIVLYFVMKKLRKRKGIDVGLAFKEIPIE